MRTDRPLRLALLLVALLRAPALAADDSVSDWAREAAARIAAPADAEGRMELLRAEVLRSPEERYRLSALAGHMDALAALDSPEERADLASRILLDQPSASTTPTSAPPDPWAASLALQLSTAPDYRTARQIADAAREERSDSTSASALLDTVDQLLARLAPLNATTSHMALPLYQAALGVPTGAPVDLDAILRGTAEGDLQLVRRGVKTSEWIEIRHALALTGGYWYACPVDPATQNSHWRFSMESPESIACDDQEPLLRTPGWTLTVAGEPVETEQRLEEVALVEPVDTDPRVVRIPLRSEAGVQVTFGPRTGGLLTGPGYAPSRRLVPGEAPSRPSDCRTQYQAKALVIDANARLASRAALAAAGR